MTETMTRPPLAGDAQNVNGNAMVRAERHRVVVQDDSSFANLLDTGRFEHMWRLSQLFAKSALVPAHFQGKTEDCFVAMQMAIRLSVDPFMFLQNTYVVHGRPGMEAKLAIALINSSGLFTDSLDYEVEGDDPAKADYRVRAVAHRKTSGKKVLGPWVDWKIVRAEGWDAKGGSKWKTIPGLMFQYRAATWFGRLHCPERLMGMQTVDELHDTGGDRVLPTVTDRGTKALITRIRNTSARPPSEGQTLELDTGEIIDGGTGEVSPQEQIAAHDFAKPEKPEPDVAGADAEPPAENAPTGREAFLIQAEDARQASGIINEIAFKNALKKWALKCAVVGKEHEATAEQLASLWTAIAKHEGYFAGM